MSETTTEAAQGQPDGETVVLPVTIDGSDTGAEQTIQAQTDDAGQEPEPKKTPWFQRRIDELTRQKYDAQRETERLHGLLRQAPQDPGARPSDVVPLAEVERRAAQIVNQRQFDRACNDIYEAGVTAHPDFDQAAENFRLLGGEQRAFLDVVTELGKEAGAKVYYELGKNPEEAARILSLSPVKMAMALTQLADAPRKTVPASRAPAPIQPIGGIRANSGGPPSPDNDAEYSAWFMREYRKRR